MISDLKKKRMERSKVLINELVLYNEARAEGKHGLCFKHLGRAHIIAQSRWFHHFYVHFLMLEYAWKRKDFKELFGQIIRMAATIPGHLFGKLPVGNIGWASVGIFERMPIPEDLKSIV